MRVKGASQLPDEYATAGFEPTFPSHFQTAQDFTESHSQLAKLGEGKEALKRFVINRFETLVGDIQQKLLAYSASLSPPKDQPAPARIPIIPEYQRLFDQGQQSGVEARRTAVADAKDYLGVLQSSAENPENKKKLEDAVTELGILDKLFPVKPETPHPSSNPPSEPANAEKVAARLTQIRENVRQAAVSSWMLDEAFDNALQITEAEERNYLGSDLRVRQMKEQLYLSMAEAMAGGFVIGVFFFLIGDWTEKAATEVLDYSSELFKDFSADPEEIYEMIQQAVAQKDVPELECTRAFWHEGGAISAKREYLRIARERLCFEICAAPFGTGFFFSYRATMVPLVVDPLGIFLLLAVTGGFLAILMHWFGLMWAGIILMVSLAFLIFIMRFAVARGLSNLDRVFMKTPLLGPLYEIFLRPLTYYRIDSEIMYLKAVHEAVAGCYAKVFGDQGVAMMPEFVQAPILDMLYRR